MTNLDEVRIQFCFVPEGDFFCGSSETDDMAYEDEKPIQKIHLKSFFISQTTITNGQFFVFIEEKGYSYPEFWKEAITYRFWVSGYVKSRYDKIYRNHPVYFNSSEDLRDDPVVGVSWYEAMAFTRWLENEFKSSVGEREITLPTEFEWEKAAKGGIQIPKELVMLRLSDLVTNPEVKTAMMENPAPQRIYPNLNFFRENTSPYGVINMSGNVWEWTLSLYDAYLPTRNTDTQLNAPPTLKRTLRGGALDESNRLARCSARYRGYPIGRSRDTGFRIIVK